MMSDASDKVYNAIEKLIEVAVILGDDEPQANRKLQGIAKQQLARLFPPIPVVDYSKLLPRVNDVQFDTLNRREQNCVQMGDSYGATRYMMKRCKITHELAEQYVNKWRAIYAQADDQLS